MAPFERGVMGFEDFNYEMYNQYIFSLDPNDEQSVQDAE